jgi:hypothetical protein
MGKNPSGARNMGEIFMRYFIFGLLVFLGLVVGWRTINLWNSPEDCYFPAVTMDRVSGDRIWLWDGYKECKYNVIVPEEVEMDIEVTGFVHEETKDVPTVEFVVVSDENQELKGKMPIVLDGENYVIHGVNLYPYEEILVKPRTK